MTLLGEHRAEIIRLEAAIDRWREDCKREYRGRIAAEGWERALREALSGVEWLPGPHTAHDGVLECPECGQGQYQGHMGDCLIGAALAAMPADLLARRQREQSIIRAAIEYRQANAILDSEPEPHPDPLARTFLIQICEQKRAALFAAVDGEARND